jgi:hypothetical protein
MAYPWSTTVTHPGGIAVYAGIAETSAAARVAAAEAGASHAQRTDAGETCRYTLRVQDAITAIVSTGTGDGDHPEHHHAAALMADLYSGPTPDIAWPTVYRTDMPTRTERM